DTKLKFIFSHSALREGWDNPNVFQICTLREIGTELERRQTIGRGLRLSVNQKGERLRGFEINTLTVIATESYEAFAENLQKEIEADTGIRFGVVEEHIFAGIALMEEPPKHGAPGVEEEGTQYESGVPKVLGYERSAEIFRHLRALDLIDRHGKVQDGLRAA